MGPSQHYRKANSDVGASLEEFANQTLTSSKVRVGKFREQLQLLEQQPLQLAGHDYSLFAGRLRPR